MLKITAMASTFGRRFAVSAFLTLWESRLGFVVCFQNSVVLCSSGHAEPT